MKPRNTLIGIFGIAVVAVSGSVAFAGGQSAPSPREYAKHLIESASPAAQETVSDASVSEVEVRTAFADYLACIREAGYVAIPGTSPSGLPTASAVAVGDIVDSAEAIAAKDICDADWRLVVSVAFAERHVGKDNSAAAREFTACRSAAKGDVAARASCSEHPGSADAATAVPGLLEEIRAKSEDG